MEKKSTDKAGEKPTEVEKKSTDKAAKDPVQITVDQRPAGGPSSEANAQGREKNAGGSSHHSSSHHQSSSGEKRMDSLQNDMKDLKNMLENLAK